MSRSPLSTSGPGSGAGSLPRASILERLLETPARGGAAEGLRAIEAAVRRDIEILLNARKPWRSVPARFPSLATSTLGYGLADFTGGAAADGDGQERLRAEIETAIARFEPRLTAVEVEIVGKPTALRSLLSFRISGMLLVEPVAEPVSFDTVADTVTADITLRTREER